MSAKRLGGWLIVIVACAAPSSFGQAQDGGPPGPPDFAEMRQRMMNRIREIVGASDDEWKALQPKIEKVQQLQRDASPRGMGMMMFGPGPGGPPPGGPGGPPPGGPGGPPPGFGPGDPSDVQEKSMDLRSTLQDKEAKPEDVKAKLQALRDARNKARSDLAKAQEDLKGLLTSRQEAALVMLGFLD